MKQQKQWEMIRSRIYANQGKMLETLAKLIAIPSVAVPAADGMYPYGDAPAKALDFMLAQLADMGMHCRNYDYHMGTADWTKDNTPYLGILCHLDVVPAVPENWKTAPYRMEIRDGRIYGRGAIDDKGPAVAVLYALKALKEVGVSLGKNLRFLLGCNEENGSTDLAYYLTKEKMPPNVFTPDGSYPLIHLEKGMLRLRFAKKTSDVLLAFSGGTVPNAVPALAQATVKNELLPEHSEVVVSGNQISFHGIAAHASTPESGVNGITGLLTYLAKQRDFSDCKALSVLFPHGCTDGSGFGIACADAESGALTCVCSMLHLEDGQLQGCMDIRFPVCTTKEQIFAQVREKLAQAGFSCEVLIQSDPHHTPKETPLVQQLLAVYTEQTGKPGECVAIGGGTYVHDIPGGVAFGMEYPGWDYRMHGDDEFIPVQQLLENTEMMAAAILRICGEESFS